MSGTRSSAVFYDARVEFAASGKALVVLPREGGQELRICEPGVARCGMVPIEAGPRKWKISDDGRWIAGYSHEHPLELWDAASGASTLRTDAKTAHVAISRDGSALAWVGQAQRKPGFKVQVRRIGAATDVKEAEFDGWPAWIELSRDGAPRRWS